MPNWLRKVPHEQRYQIVKVTKLDCGNKKVYIENSLGSSEVFLYDGRLWRWWESNHIIEPPLCKNLTKEYKRYLKKMNKE